VVCGAVGRRTDGGGGGGSGGKPKRVVMRCGRGR